MGQHLIVDNLGSGLEWDEPTQRVNATGGGPVFDGRYLAAAADSDQTASFIDADTNTGGAFAFSLRDADHAAGMHYHIRVDSGTSALTVQRASTSTKTISGNFVGQTLSGVSSLSLFRDDGILRIKPDGSNWAIY